MPARRRSYSRSPRTRRRYAWETSIFDPEIVTIGNQAYGGLLAVPAVNTIEALSSQGQTVLRCIGSLRINSTHATDSVEWAAGITMVGPDAFAAGNLPDPVTDSNEKWMWWMARVSPPPGAGGTAIQIDLDVKAKRRRASGDEMAFIIDNHDSAQQLEFALSVRVLVQLP